MKEYTYYWAIKDLGMVEVPETDYTSSQMEMKKFIDKLSDVVADAKCGWKGVMFKVMRTDDLVYEYMVLHDGNEHCARWIHIDGNSKGCNLSVLGENLW